MLWQSYFDFTVRGFSAKLKDLSIWLKFVHLEATLDSCTAAKRVCKFKKALKFYPNFTPF